MPHNIGGEDQVTLCASLCMNVSLATIASRTNGNVEDVDYLT